MTSSAFLSIKKLSGSGHLLSAARHNRRTIQAELGANDHIDPSRTRLNRTLLGADTPEGVAKQAKEMMRSAGVTKLRKDAVTALEVIFSIPDSLVIDREAYFAKCIAWAGDEFGGMDNILSADLHNDEAHPHLHVLVLPLREGRMVGSEMMGNRQALVNRQKRFYEEVASPFGFPKPPPRLTGDAKVDAVRRVLATLNARNDKALRSDMWPVIRTIIESDPAPWLAQLGLQANERPKRLRSSTDIFISPGKGPKREVNPIGFSFNPVRKDRSLSCVGFAPDAAADSEAATALADRCSASKEPLNAASPASTSTEASLDSTITALEHQDTRQAHTAQEHTTFAGHRAGCRMSCGDICEPLQMKTDATKPADQPRKPKVAHGCVNVVVRSASRMESTEPTGQVAYRLPTSSPETTKPSLANWAKCLIYMVPEKGIEPSTFSLRMSCSTD